MADKLNYTDFSSKIKTKYPEYKDIDDKVLAEKMVEKYPEYKDQVMFEVEKKSPDETQSSGDFVKAVPQDMSPFDQLGLKQLNEKPSVEVAQRENKTPAQEVESVYQKQVLPEKEASELINEGEDRGAQSLGGALSNAGKSVADFTTNTLPANLKSGYSVIAPALYEAYKDGQYATGKEPPKDQVPVEEYGKWIKTEAVKNQLKSRAETQAKKLGTTSKISDIDNPYQAIEYTLNTVGQAGVQIPLSLATLGGTSYLQEIGTAQQSAIDRISKDEGITPEEVVQQGLDKPLQALIVGAVSGSLDRLGALKVLKSIGTKGLKGKAINWGTEGLTESLQGQVQKAGEELSSNKPEWDKFVTTNNLKDFAEEGVAGLIGAAGVSTAVSGVESSRKSMLPSANLNDIEKRDEIIGHGVEDHLIDTSIKNAPEIVKERLKQQENDNINEQGISSEIGVGQEPIQAQPVEVSSEEAIGASGNVQSNEKINEEDNNNQQPEVQEGGEIQPATETPFEGEQSNSPDVLPSSEGGESVGGQTNVDDNFIVETHPKTGNSVISIRKGKYKDVYTYNTETNKLDGSDGEILGAKKDFIINKLNATTEPNPINEAVEGENTTIQPEIQKVGDIASEESPKERRFAKQVLESPEITQEIKDKIPEEAKYYQPISNEKTNKVANKIIDDLGIDDAIKVYQQDEVHPAVRSFLGENLIVKLNDLSKKSETKQGKDSYLDQAIEVANKMAIDATEAGQQIQALSAFTRLTPEGQLRAITKEYKKTKDSILQIAQPELSDIKTKIDTINSEVSQNVIPELSKPKETRKDKVKKAVDILNGLKIKTKGTAFDATIGIPVGLYNESINIVRDAIIAGDAVITAIEKGAKYISKKFKKDWDKDKYTNQLHTSLSPANLDTDILIKNALKDMGVKLNDIVIQHYTKVDQSKSDLTNKIISETNLPAEAAQQLASDIQLEFDNQATKRKQQILNKMLKIADRTNPKERAKKLQLHESIIKASNLGALKDSDYRKMYSEKMQLPELSAEEAQKIMDFAEKAQTAKEGEAKNKATQDLIKYQQSLKGVTAGDVAMSIWYANILSGISTQTTNVYANLTNTFGEVWTDFFKNPKQAAFSLKGIYEGWGHGLLQAMDIAKTGYQPQRGSKVEGGSVLENTKFKGGKWNPYNYAKYVGRIMTAADAFSYAGLKEYRVRQLAYSEAMKQGKSLPSKEIIDKAVQILNNSKERISKAKEQALQEGKSGNELKRRTFELIEQSRPADINANAMDFASRGTFNFEPEGIFGAMAHGIDYATNKVDIKGIKPLRLIVPFTRIISNVMNNGLDYSPWGLVRAAKGGLGYSNSITKDKFVKRYNRDEKIRETIKGATGTLAMVALYALTESGEDGEEPAMEISGKGTGNQQHDFQLQETGWRPYSVKINGKWFEYKNTPLAIPFSIIGFIRDGQKYHNADSIEDDVASMVYASVSYLMDSSFLSSMASFFESFTSKSQDGAEKWMQNAKKTAFRTAKGFVIPNVVTQISRSIQEITDSPLKKVNNPLEDIYRDMPLLRDNLDNMYNVLGEPIMADQNRKYIPFKVKGEQNNEIWDLIIKNKAFIGRPNRTKAIYDGKEERSMTPQEYDKYSLLSAKKTKEGIQNDIDYLKTLSQEEVQQEIKNILQESRNEAEYELFSSGSK